MSRLSQFFWYINAEDHPTRLEQRHHYTDLDITPALKKIRRDYRRAIRLAQAYMEKEGRED